jgi:hypothetical protein
MEEMLKIIYRNYLADECNDWGNETESAKAGSRKIDDGLEILRETVNEKIFDDVYDKITDGTCDMREAMFTAGFAYCAKFMSNGKIDFMGK